ncbi:MAG TPA: c-type cytochrome domain-containing protein, partial [Verrucomicrobium sp.]|nr:c-type cytochrome domain-containing protein [Verrucomicrobium sp.]
MPRSFRAALWHLPATLLLASSGTAAWAAEVTSQEGLAFFEKKVRPLLIEKCQDCHSPEKKIKGGLRLDTKAGWQKGGDSGAALTPHDPEHSIFMKAVSYQDRDLKMPPKQKLSDAEIEVFREWIAMGAPDPRQDAEKEVTVA